VKRNTRSPKNTIAKVTCPEGRAYPVSFINIESGLGILKRFFRIVITKAVIIEVEARRMAWDFLFFR